MAEPEGKDPGDPKPENQDPGGREEKPGATSKDPKQESHLQGELKEARSEAARYRTGLREAEAKVGTLTTEVKGLNEKIDSQLPDQERRSKGLERENVSLKTENEKLQGELSGLQGQVATAKIGDVCDKLVRAHVAPDRQADALDLMKSRTHVTDANTGEFVINFDGGTHTPEGYVRVWLDMKGDTYRQATQKQGGSGSGGSKVPETGGKEEPAALKQAESPMGAIGMDPNNLESVKDWLKDKYGER